MWCQTATKWSLQKPHEPGVVGLLMGAQKVGSDDGKDLLTLTKRRKNASFGFMSIFTNPTVGWGWVVESLWITLYHSHANWLRDGFTPLLLINACWVFTEMYWLFGWHEKNQPNKTNRCMCFVLIMTKWRDPYASDASEQINMGYISSRLPLALKLKHVTQHTGISWPVHGSKVGALSG